MPLSALIGAGFVLWGAYIGSVPFNDNSFFTHLATGRLLLEDGFIRSDPYSFTAPGEPWVIQSWLVSVIFAGVERLAGSGSVHLVVIALTATLGGLVWSLTREAHSLLARVGVGALAVAVGGFMWGERPLLVGLVGLALVLMACEGRLDPRLMVPLFWVWANSHGSFPLGVVAAGTLAVGVHLDGNRPERELAVLRWSLLGLALAVVGPLGFQVLVFPVQLLRRSEILQSIVEWQSPDFSEVWVRIFLLQVLLAIAVLVRRPRWRTAVPLAVFTSLALLAARNIAVASLVLVPVTSVGLSGLGSLTGERRSRGALLGVGLVSVAVLGLALVAVGRDPVDLQAYPMHALGWWAHQDAPGGETRMFSKDLVGNLLEGIRGDEADVFIDDRYDMYPVEVVQDYEQLAFGTGDWEEVLAAWEVDAVLWSRTEPLTSLVVGSSAWRIAFADESWVLAVRR